MTTNNPESVTVEQGEQDRFWSHVDRKSDEQCWEWTGGKTGRGYGRFYSRSIPAVAAHRVALILSGTSFKQGEVADHICRNRICCNPAHLRAVSPRINSIENSIGPTAINHAKSACAQGHEFTPENTIMKRGRRHCRECQRRVNREHMRRKAAALQGAKP